MHAAEFQRVFDQATRSADGLFTVLGRSNDLGGPRLGMAISARNTGNAVRRNRMKRLIRETFRHEAARLPGIDLVVMARPGAADKPAARMRASLQSHFRRLGEQCAPSSSR